jgi:Na+/H+ antiporter NhaA
MWLEASVILWLALITTGVHLVVARIIAIAFLIVGYGVVESSVRKLSKKLKVQHTPEKQEELTKGST